MSALPCDELDPPISVLYIIEELPSERTFLVCDGGVCYQCDDRRRRLERRDGVFFAEGRFVRCVIANNDDVSMTVSIRSRHKLEVLLWRRSLGEILVIASSSTRIGYIG
jgi:hypothetical protein